MCAGGIRSSFPNLSQAVSAHIEMSKQQACVQATLPTPFFNLNQALSAHTEASKQ